MKRPGHQKKLEAVEMWTVIDCKAHDAVGVAMCRNIGTVGFRCKVFPGGICVRFEVATLSVSVYNFIFFYAVVTGAS